MHKPRKVLIIGSGPIVIGQAAEFDYAGTQACKAMREEGVTSVLVNSNPATIMTDEDVADVVYIEPLTVDVLTRVIERERPDGLLPTLGGQTALNLAVELADAGVLERHNVRLLGTPLETIKNAEDRERFKTMLRAIDEPSPPSRTVTTAKEADQALAEIGLPAVIRPAYTLGGTGGGIARTSDEFATLVRGGLAASPITQVLIEQSLLGWKEIEYEVMRDAADTCITVCNMENLDPMGVHTGDSIVVAPSQTLSDKDYQRLRSAALKIIRALGIEGGCNIQFALAPRPDIVEWGPAPDDGSLPYHVIEVNPRVSRSSALASKATGYPIARVAAKIAAGKRLDEIPERGHEQDQRRVRAGAGLRRGQDPAVAVRQVRRRRPFPGHADEGHRGSHGYRAQLRRCLAEGRALAGDRWPHIAVGGARGSGSLDRRADRHGQPPLAPHGRAASRRGSHRPSQADGGSIRGSWTDC